VVDRARAILLASLASFALSAARSQEDSVRLADDLHAALATREVIGQAQGILMERERVTASQAFDILRRASQHLNRKLRDVAQDLVDTGEAPDRGTPRS
jgi:AmiR/NasT family two-component response regulator